MSKSTKSAGDPVATSSSVEQHEPGTTGHSLAPANGVPPLVGALFFDLSARYEIAPGAGLSALVDDCQCLLESGLGALQEHGCEDFDHTRWAAVYMLRQAGAVFDEIHRRLFAGERIERGQA